MFGSVKNLLQPGVYMIVGMIVRTTIVFSVVILRNAND